jgi:hypothetical protein
MLPSFMLCYYLPNADILPNAASKPSYSVPPFATEHRPQTLPPSLAVWQTTDASSTLMIHFFIKPNKCSHLGSYPSADYACYIFALSFFCSGT